MRRRDLHQSDPEPAIGWPLAARAQQPERKRHIGVLTPIPADDLEARARIAAFLPGWRY